MSRAALVLVLVLGSALACAPEPFSEAQVLGGVKIPASSLNRGFDLYQRHCLPCHGEQGDGRGPSSWGAWPAPRDFRLAKFKFAGVLDRGLPNDDELVRIVRDGLPGTSMPAWDLPDAQLRAVLHYIKTFSSPGQGFRNPDLEVQRHEIPPDPWVSKKSEALERGSLLYHSIFQCTQCHPLYATQSDFARWKASPPRADDPELSVVKPAPGYSTVLLPPDFRHHRMRAVRHTDAGFVAADLYRAIAFGLSGPMPGYVHLGEADVWAVAHYVKKIADAGPIARD